MWPRRNTPRILSTSNPSIEWGSWMKELCYMQKKSLYNSGQRLLTQPTIYITELHYDQEHIIYYLYQLWKGRKPNVKYFIFSYSTCCILADREYHKKWDANFDKVIFLGYSLNSRAYHVFNKRTQIVMEIINVIVIDNEKIYPRRPNDGEFFYDSITQKNASLLSCS